MDPGTSWTFGSVVILIGGLVATVGLYGVAVWLHIKEWGK